MIEILEKIIGTHSRKKLKNYRNLVHKVNQLEEKFRKIANRRLFTFKGEEDCKQKTLEFKE